MSTLSSEQLEQVLCLYPLLTRVVSELEPGEFRNLLLSGQRVPMSRSEANKFLISMVCGLCRNNNATRKITPCVGTFFEPIILDLENVESYWSQPTAASNFKCVVDEPENTCCHLCIAIERLTYHRIMANGSLGEQYSMCKTHCLEKFHPPPALPNEKCRCGAWLIEESWRCPHCFITAFIQLGVRGRNFESALRYRQTTTTFATQEPTFEYSADEPGLEETCCMMDCKERVWDDVESPAFLLFCSRCSTIYRKNDMPVIRELYSSA